MITVQVDLNTMEEIIINLFDSKPPACIKVADPEALKLDICNNVLRITRLLGGIMMLCYKVQGDTVRLGP